MGCTAESFYPHTVLSDARFGSSKSYLGHRKGSEASRRLEEHVVICRRNPRSTPMNEDYIAGRLTFIHVQIDLGTTVANLARTEYGLGNGAHADSC